MHFIPSERIVIDIYYAYHHIRVDSRLLLSPSWKRKALWTGSVPRRLGTTPKIGREAPRDDDFSIIAKKHFFNNFQHFLTFFNMFSTYFHARNNVENIFHIFNIYRRVARRHATTQRAPKIGREPDASRRRRYVRPCGQAVSRGASRRPVSIFRFSACLVARRLATLIPLAFFDVSQNTDAVARRHATTEKTP